MGSRRGVGRRTILVAEGQAVLAIWLEDVLTAAGFEVSGLHAATADALAALDRREPDAAVISVDLREGPCFPLACALRRRSVPFLLLSGSVPVPRAFADVAVLQRPCSDAELVRLVEGLLPHGTTSSRRPCPAAARLRRGDPVELDQCPFACGRDDVPVSVAPFLARRALTLQLGDRHG